MIRPAVGRVNEVEVVGVIDGDLFDIADLCAGGGSTVAGIAIDSRAADGADDTVRRNLADAPIPVIRDEQISVAIQRQAARIVQRGVDRGPTVSGKRAPGSSRNARRRAGRVDPEDAVVTGEVNGAGLINRNRRSWGASLYTDRHFHGEHRRRDRRPSGDGCDGVLLRRGRDRGKKTEEQGSHGSGYIPEGGRPQRYV